MFDVIVINKYTAKPNQNVKRIYIGRGSPLGNPWVISDLDTRDMVCEWHEHSIRKEWSEALNGGPKTPMINEIIAIANRVKNGEQIALECFCKPKRCHGDFIAKLINWYASEVL
jgi:hypothetical protein